MELVAKKARKFMFGSLDQFKLLAWIIMPVILAQVLQRLYPVVDNYFVGKLGSQALLIHNMQYSFLYIGQFIGGATATSCLIFWKRNEYIDKQKQLLMVHVALCATISLIVLLLGVVFSNKILSHFAIKQSYFLLAKKYLIIGLINMVLQALFIGLIGVVVAVKKEFMTLLFSFFLLFSNIVLDYISISVFYTGIQSSVTIVIPMLSVGLSTTLLMLMGVVILLRKIVQLSTGWGVHNLKEICRIWSNELGGALISSIYPVIYMFQLAAVPTSSGLIVSYQLIFQFYIITYLFFIHYPFF